MGAAGKGADEGAGEASEGAGGDRATSGRGGETTGGSAGRGRGAKVSGAAEYSCGEKKGTRSRKVTFREMKRRRETGS